MLRIAKMEILGFKSFGDRTEVVFPSGVTAIVGPNGCGKSNIGDAINWVLGEQSPKTLRGKQMADVIFGGSAARKPLGLAEVSIHMTGSEGLRHSENGEVTLTRRLFRSGDSEYLLNGKKTRLKDIQELLHEARVGVRTYATIEQGKIDHILSAKPKERRMIIEDAAGISGYKHKRRLTELKLEATESNLLRVNDIVVEVERQIRSLKRQASKARRYRRLRDELKGKQGLRFAMRAEELNAKLAALGEAESRAKDGEAVAAARLGRMETELVEGRSALDGSSEEFRQASERLHKLDIEIDRDEAKIRGCREKIDESGSIAGRRSAEAEQLAGRLAGARVRSDEHARLVERAGLQLAEMEKELSSWQTAKDEAERERLVLREEIEALRNRQFESVSRTTESRNRLRSTEESLERIRARIVRLEAEVGSAAGDLSRIRSETDELAARAEDQRGKVYGLRSTCEECEERLAEARDLLSSEIDAMTEWRELEKSSSARLGALEDVATRFAGVSDGVRALLNDGASAGVRTLGVAADFIEAGSDIESLAEGYLQSFLPSVILEDDADVHRAAQMLRSVGAGRTNLISKSQPAGRPAVGASANGHGEIPAELMKDPRIKGRLLDSLKLRASANGAVRERIGEALVVDSLESALDLHRTYPTVDYLTLSGDVVYASGVVSAGGLESGDRGLLAHKRRTEETRSQSIEASRQAAERQGRVEAARREVAALESEVGEHRQALEEATRLLMELDMQLERSSDDGERSGRRAEVLEDELAGLREEAAGLERIRAELGTEVAESEEKDRSLEEELRLRAEDWKGREERFGQLAERVVALRESFAAQRQRQDSLEGEAGSLAEAAAELQARVDAAQEEAEAARRSGALAAEMQAAAEADLLRNLEESKLLKERLAEMERGIAEKRRSLSDRELELRRARADLETLRESTREAELERTKAEAERRHLDDLCAQELGVSAAQLSLQESPPDEIDLDELEAEIEALRGKIERIGPVNLESIEEFSDLEERHLFLTSQRADLEESMISLKETIKRINRTSRERFIRTFESVRTSFQDVFKLLFKGGRADLRLEEGEDILECGVEILAQPPGKRLGSLQLLSGGEKALSAIALLFAIFRTQPSPFCLLDEVDAALDDSNIGRFTRMVREYAENTQFIIITHNKLSMESADLLYGVTMEEPGISRLVSMQLN
jgi:chromosome segregation protein